MNTQWRWFAHQSELTHPCCCIHFTNDKNSWSLLGPGHWVPTWTWKDKSWWKSGKDQKLPCSVKWHMEPARDLKLLVKNTKWSGSIHNVELRLSEVSTQPRVLLLWAQGLGFYLPTRWEPFFTIFGITAGGRRTSACREPLLFHLIPCSANGKVGGGEKSG